MSARVAVIMRTKNSDWVVAQALASLFAQDVPDFELIVVDSGSTDRTLDLLAAWPHRLIRIPAQRYHPGPVLNDAIAAIAESDHELLVFWNSDGVALVPQTLRRLLEPFSDPAVVATFARQVPRPEADTWVRRDYTASFPAAAPAPPWIPLSLVVSAIRRSAWSEHPFYADAWGSEDTEWGHWARSHGKRVVYAADAPVMHSHNYTLAQLYGRQFIEGEADVFIYGVHHPLIGSVARAVMAAMRDAAWSLRAGDVRGLLLAPLRRATAAWGYWRGQRLGEQRRATGNRDATQGQAVVLRSHESNRGPS